MRRIGDRHKVDWPVRVVLGYVVTVVFVDKEIVVVPVKAGVGQVVDQSRFERDDLPPPCTQNYRC